MSLPRYPEYKDSGVEWLGELPAGWKLTLLKRLGTIRYGIGEPPTYKEEGVPLIRATNVHEGQVLSKGLVYVDPDDIPSQRILWLREGDVIVVRSGAYTGDSALITDEYEGAIAGFDMVFRPHSCLPAFVKHSLLSCYLKNSQLDLKKMRAAQPHLNAEELGECIFALPTQEEQSAIALFLDRETAKIDALIAEQEKLLTLLAEKRQATISHAVTKGLNPDVQMKDSRVEWLGKVPAHWPIGKIQTFARRESGHTPSRQHPEYWESCTIPWFSLADVWQLRTGNIKYVYETKELVSELGLANSSARLLPAGTVMLSRTASVGYSAIMGCDMATTQDFINWVCKPELISEFLLYVLRGMKSEFARLMMGSTHQTIYMPDLAKLMMGLPTMDEQAEIVSFLDTETSRLDTLTVEATRAIDLLKERRTALISAAVTGKIDVRSVRPEKETCHA